jgi:hypothetical protein
MHREKHGHRRVVALRIHTAELSIMHAVWQLPSKAQLNSGTWWKIWEWRLSYMLHQPKYDYICCKNRCRSTYPTTVACTWCWHVNYRPQSQGLEYFLFFCLSFFKNLIIIFPVH